MKKILVRGNITVTGYIQTISYPVEAFFEAAGGEDVVYNDSDFDLVIKGDLKIENICIMSNDIKVYATGLIIVCGV